MRGRDQRRRALIVALVASSLCARTTIAGDQQSAARLRKDLEAMRRRVDQIERTTQEQAETIRRQEAIIQKLSGAPATPPNATTPAVAPPPATTAHDEQLKADVTDSIMRRIQPSLAAANKSFASQFNPAIGVMIDTVASHSDHDRANFEFRSGEVALSASIDPFVRGFAAFNGGPDGIEVEEANITTTSLPYNLTLKGGRLFADFGRLSKFHDHDLPFVNRPMVLDRYVGGESQADGLEASWLVPIPQYLTLTAGAYNKLGGDNERVSNTVGRNYSEFTYLTRAFTFLPISDAHSVDLGASWAYTPTVKLDRGHDRTLAGVDLTYRYARLDAAAYNGFTWGTELLYNREHRPVGGFPDDLSAAASLPFHRRDALGLYSYVELKATRRFSPGFLFEWVQDVDKARGDTYGYSPYLTVWASEFQRLRFQYTREEAPRFHDNQFFLQWTVILGSHAHTFKDR